MILPKFQARQFFTLFDVVTVMGNRFLGVMPEEELLSGDGPRGIGEAEQREVCKELWAQPTVLDKLVDGNPLGLTAGELGVLESWKCAYSDMFFIDRCSDGVLRFCSHGYAFEVCGMSQEIEGMLNQVPTVAKTTLLPFHGHVVYAMFLAEMPILIGENMLKTMREEMEKSLAEGKVISTGQQFCTIIPGLKQKIEDDAVADLQREIEMEERAAGPLPGQHRGALAGLSEEERDAAIQARMDEIDAKLRASGKPTARTLEEMMEERCTEGPLKTGLAELLNTAELPDPSVFADAIRSMTLDDLGIDSEANPEMAERFAILQKEAAEVGESTTAGEMLVPRYTDAEYLQEDIGSMSAYQIERLRALAEAGGRMSFPDTGLTTLRDMPLPERGLCYIFHEEGSYEFVMPDEVVPVAAQLDWDAALLEAKQRDELVKFFDIITELRGIVHYSQAIEEYVRCVPDGFEGAQRIHDELIGAIECDISSACLLDAGSDGDDEVYLLHYELIWAYRENKGLDPYTDSVVEEGDLDDMLRGLLRQQAGKPPRPVLPEMMAEPSLFYWKEKQPPARAMRNFLDEHVPDDGDDYFFADKVMEDLLDEAKWGMLQGNVQVLFDILGANGFAPDESQLQKIVDLWMNMFNGLPVWPNNGWAPAELASAVSGQRTFFNEDGSPMKVGRNDPCPCGSGKKYKKCCGR